MSLRMGFWRAAQAPSGETKIVVSRMKLRRICVTFALFPLLLGGCSIASTEGLHLDVASGAADENTEMGPTGASPKPDGERQIPPAQKYTELNPEPPLARFIPYVDGPRMTTEELDEMERWRFQHGDAVARCMAVRGFRYVPTGQISSPAATGRGIILKTVPVPVLGSERAVVSKNGYGLMPALTSEQLASDDPNLTYQESLSKAEAEAYTIALNGDYHVPTTEGSCLREAWDAFPQPTGYADRLKRFQAEYGDMLQAMLALVKLEFQDDTRIVALNREWEHCMNKRTFFLGEGDVVTDVGPSAAFFLAVRTRPDGTVGSLNFGVPLSNIPPEEESLLGTEPERKVALADFDCRVETDYMARITKIRFAMDEAFIAEHQAELDRLVAAADSW